jgi:poly(hydroxyalkanoate) depolymerase family esterase
MMRLAHFADGSPDVDIMPGRSGERSLENRLSALNLCCAAAYSSRNVMAGGIFPDGPYHRKPATSGDAVFKHRALRRLCGVTISNNFRAFRQIARMASRFAGAEMRSAWRGHQAAETAAAHADITSVAAFDSGPGHLRMLEYCPRDLPAGRPVVVLLHGCGQQASQFATDTGWIELANQCGFSLVLPEQRRSNNRGRCYRWFERDQIGRGLGEVGSIRQMVESALQRHQGDRKKVFVAGLSAGGAMAAALLAAYPEYFAAGAVVAGMPVGAATSPMEALVRMAHPGPDRTEAEWADQVRRLSSVGPGRGRWPRLSIWHGEADATVVPRNSELLALQWRGLHQLHEVPHRDLRRGTVRCRRWGDQADPDVELWTIDGMAHGYPIKRGLGQASQFVLEAPISATLEIARFWGLIDGKPGSSE